MTMRVKQDIKGFTLIELMITVAIVAILAAIAYPSYVEHVRKSNRSAAQSFIMEVSTRQEQFLLDKRSYATSLVNLNTALPSDLLGKYTVTIHPNLDCSAGGLCTTPCYCIKATAAGAQLTDGDLTLNSLGQKTPLSKWK